MATPQQKAFCVLRFAKSESVSIVQREFRKQFQNDPPCTTVPGERAHLQGESAGRPRMSEENVNRIRESYARSPCKSLSEGNRKFSIPQTTLWRVLRKRSVMKAYKLQ
jgi:hypothetical protein